MRLIADNRSAPVCATVRTDIRGFTLIELMVVIAIMGILAAIALPNYTKLKTKAREAETKSALHNIQLELERFAVDHDGCYPDYLTGGDNTVYIGPTNNQTNFAGHVVELPTQASSDILIREGYVDCYPRNPFVADGRAVFLMQFRAGDALRSLTPSGEMFGTRFGASGQLMGQLLCDPRWMTRDYINPDGETTQVETYSSIQYNVYDVWLGNLQKPFLPGSFMYKSMGDVIPTPGRRDHLVSQAGLADVAQQPDSWDRVTVPISMSKYILSAWGGFHTKGMDLLGEEPLVLFDYRGTKRVHGSGGVIFSPQTGGAGMAPGTVDFYNLLGIPPWTRGVNRSHVGPLWGSPFGPGQDGQQLSYGNPNGLRDALILMLTAGENRDADGR